MSTPLAPATRRLSAPMRLPFGTALLALLLPLVAAAPQRRLQQTSSEEAVLGYLRNGSRLSQQQADMLEGKCCATLQLQAQGSRPGVYLGGCYRAAQKKGGRWRSAGAEQQGARSPERCTAACAALQVCGWTPALALTLAYWPPCRATCSTKHWWVGGYEGEAEEPRLRPPDTGALTRGPSTAGPRLPPSLPPQPLPPPPVAARTRLAGSQLCGCTQINLPKLGCGTIQSPLKPLWLLLPGRCAAAA